MCMSVSTSTCLWPNDKKNIYFTQHIFIFQNNIFTCQCNSPLVTFIEHKVKNFILKLSKYVSKLIDPTLCA